VQPLGFSARASIVPFKRVIGALGAEASLYWNYLSGEAEDYNMNAHLAGLDVKVLVQWALYQRMLFLNIRAGGGLGSMINFHFEYYDGTNSEPPLTVFMPSVGGGLSLQWLFYRHAFVEAGAEFTHYFSVDSISPAYIKPGIHFGWQF
jgi:hypothetical protein